MANKSSGVCGIGYKDQNTDVVVNGKLDPAYRCWTNMLFRATQDEGSYKDVTVDSEWHKYETFREWFYKNKGVGKALDKDIIGDGTIYGPEYCCMISQKLNNFLIGWKGKTHESPYGSRVMRGGSWVYKAYVRNTLTGEREFLGSYKRVEEAQEVWRKRKAEIAVEIANQLDDDRISGALRQKFLRGVDFPVKGWYKP